MGHIILQWVRGRSLGPCLDLILSQERTSSHLMSLLLNTFNFFKERHFSSVGICSLVFLIACWVGEIALLLHHHSQQYLSNSPCADQVYSPSCVMQEPFLLEPPGVQLWSVFGQNNTRRKHAWPDGKNANRALSWVTRWTKCHVTITPVPTIPPVSPIEPPEGHSCRSSPDLQNTCRLPEQTRHAPRRSERVRNCFTV